MNMKSVNPYQPPRILIGISKQQYEQDCACSVESGSIYVLAANKSNFLDGDCACSTDGNYLLDEYSLQSVSSSLWYVSPDLYTYSIQDDDIVCNSLGSVGPVVLNRTAREILNSFICPKTLQDGVANLVHLPGDMTMAAATRMIKLGLLIPHDLKNVIEQKDTTLTAWLHLTDRCNLRCSYCYLPHVREDMSIETGHGSIDAIFRSALANGFKRVKIKYAGGEPLLRFPLIVNLHQYAQALAKKNKIILEGIVLSNGTLLTAEIVDSLKGLSLHLMISLDGLSESHDRHRPYPGGRSSFADVSNAVQLALVNALIPDISITVSGRTAENLHQLISWILEYDLPFSLNFYRENELSASNTDMRLSEENIINGMLTAFKVIETNLPRRSLLPALVDRANLSAPHLHTCGVGQSYLVFDQNGQVAKCQMHIRKPITNIQVEDPLAVIRADQIGLQNLSVEEKEGCRTCEWKYWCAGGCSLATYRATGRYDVKSPNCNIYKALYPEAVRLEGLRLLKYANDPEVVLQ